MQPKRTLTIKGITAKITKTAFDIKRDKTFISVDTFGLCYAET